MKINSRYTIAFFSILSIGLVLYYLGDIVSYIVLAWVLSMIGAPVVTFLKKFMNKNLAAILTLGLFILSFFFLLWAFVPPLVNQAKNLSNIDYSSVKNSLDEPIQDWENWLLDKGLLIEEKKDTAGVELKEESKDVFTREITLDSLIISENDSSLVSHNIVIHLEIDGNKINGDATSEKETLTHDFSSDDFFTRIKKNIFSFLDPATIQHFFSSLVGAFGNFTIGIMSIFFIAFFFLREQGLFLDGIKSFIPNEYESRTSEAVEESSELLIRYFVGVLIQMTIITIFVSICLSLLGIPNALLIGFFAAILNVIPYIGPILGAAIGIFITISSGLELSFYSELLPNIGKVVAVFACMQMLDNFILQPNIFSRSVKAHPLEIFLVVLIGAKMAGILGMVIAIPAYTVLRVIAKVFLSQFKLVQRLTQNL